MNQSPQPHPEAFQDLPVAKRRILAVAAALFGVEPPESVTVEGICEEARVSKRTFYRWFDDKHALFAETAALLAEDLVGNWRAEQGSGSPTLTRAVDFYLDIFLQEPLLRRFRQARSTHDKLGVPTETLVLPAFLDLMQEVLERETGSSPPPYLPWFLLLQLQAVLPHLVLLREAGNGEEEKRVRKALHEFLSNGIQGATVQT